MLSVIRQHHQTAACTSQGQFDRRGNPLFTQKFKEVQSIRVDLTKTEKLKVASKHPVARQKHCSFFSTTLLWALEKQQKNRQAKITAINLNNIFPLSVIILVTSNRDSVGYWLKCPGIESRYWLEINLIYKKTRPDWGGGFAYPAFYLVGTGNLCRD
jgi:hypothetical protein